MTSTGSFSASDPLISAELDTSEGRSFVRERLALYGKTVALLAFAFYVVLGALHAILGTFTPLAFVSQRATLMHLGGASVMAGVWLMARRRDSALRTLGIVDAVALVVTCSFWAAMIDARPGAYLIGVVTASITVIARAVIVPSSARRTLVLSAVAMIPTLVLSLVFLPVIAVGTQPLPHAVVTAIVSVNVALWIGAATAVATVASRVIYGLRQRVKEAVELGAYTLEQKIGSGGMGEVWRARHRMLIRPAAIKLIRPHTLGNRDLEVLMRRFEREARATAALHSPNTVELYDFGIAEDGTLYYVMELLEGFNLDELVRRFGPQPPERVVHIVGQICNSLAEAHRNGVIHRDIKPANVFITRPDGAADFVKVVDFGLVKLDPVRTPHDEPQLTAAGTTTGTPAFMAPELVIGGALCDHRTDLYSLGCVAYWLLTGKLVFEGGSMSIFADHLRTAPPPPSSRVELPIPPELERLVLECLEKQPALRPASAGVLAERLQALALPPWTQERAERWWSHHARDVGQHAPVADVLLSQEKRSRPRLNPAAAAG